MITITIGIGGFIGILLTIIFFYTPHRATISILGGYKNYFNRLKVMWNFRKISISTEMINSRGYINRYIYKINSDKNFELITVYDYDGDDDESSILSYANGRNEDIKFIHSQPDVVYAILFNRLLKYIKSLNYDTIESMENLNELYDLEIIKITRENKFNDLIGE